jgi:hypothetical protein
MRNKNKIVTLKISTERLSLIQATRQRLELQNENLRWLEDPHHYLSRVNDHLQHFFQATRGLSDKASWDVLTPAAFDRYADKLIEPMKLELLWRDMTNQANTYSLLIAYKTESLLHSLVRSINAKDLVAPAMLSRGLLEQAATAYANAVDILPIFERVARANKPVVIPAEQALSLEEKLVRSIWGTRIGKGRDLKDKTIWEVSPYRGKSIDATNILTHLQKLSASKNGLDNSVLRVYEWLSDVVHPGTQGYRMLCDDPTPITEGHTKYTIRRHGGADAEYTQSIALWATGYSAVVLRNLLLRINAAVGEMYKHLDRAYSPFRRP